MQKGPNFLYIMTDQHRADWLGCAGHPVVKTPNIDALAAHGTLFEQFYVATPVCMPNRASFMTGRYPSVHGLRYNGCTLSPRANTFIDVLRAGGYQTASIGKSHLQPFTGIEPMRKETFEEGPVTEAWKDEAQDFEIEEPQRYAGSDQYEIPTPYYGFDHVDMVTGHGDMAGGHYQQWLQQSEAGLKILANRDHELPHDYTCPQAYRTPVPENMYPSSFIKDKAISYLNSRSKTSDPFFSFVSFPDPHHPFNPPGKYWGMYNPDQFEVTIPYTDHKNAPPPLVDAIKDYEDGVEHKIKQTSFMAAEHHIREAMALTAGMITMIDDAVGEIIDALKASGNYDNTVIIFNSDHGDYMGDFNLMLKGAWPKQSINRVPMIWSDPKHRSAKRSVALCSTVDIAPSIIERANLKPFFGMQGQSFVPCLDGQTPQREKLLIEFNDSGSRQGFHPPTRVRTLQAHDWKLSVYKDLEWGELYDLKNDPKELNNLWDDPAYKGVRDELIFDLTHMLINQMDESPRSRRLA